jgi:hypothetical protein
MNLKSIVAAGAVLLGAAFSFSPIDTAEAKTRVHIGIGVGAPYYYCRDTLIFDDCYDRWPGFYRYQRPRYYYYDRPTVIYRDKASCREARRALRSYGYRSVSAIDCEGRKYSFRATRNGKVYRVRVDAYTGRISRTRM